MKTGDVGFVSTIIYTSISLVTSGLFFVVTLGGDYNWVARIGGTAWVFLLSMIVMMPVVMPLVKKKLGSRPVNFETQGQAPGDNE